MRHLRPFFLWAILSFSAGAATAPLPIAHIDSLTGAEGPYGDSADKGIRLAIEQINQAGGVKGQLIELTSIDDRSRSDEAVTAITKAITQGKVIAVLGEIASSKTLAMAPVAQQAAIPLLSPGATNTRVTQAGNYIFRVCFLDMHQANVMARFAVQDLKLKRLAIMRDIKSDFSMGMADRFKESLAKYGGELVADISYSAGEVDFRSQLLALKEKKPDAVWLPGYYGEVGLIARQARELKFMVPFLGGDGWDSPRLLEIADHALDGSYFVNHYSPDDASPETRKFVEAYKKRYGKEPDSSAALGYDAARVLANALERAKPLNSQGVREALATVKDFPGATGTITMGPDRNPVKPGVVLKVVNKGFQFHKRAP